MPDRNLRAEDDVPARAPQARALTSVTVPEPTSVAGLRATMAETAALFAATRSDSGPDVRQDVVRGISSVIPHVVGAGMMTIDRSGGITSYACPVPLVASLERLQTELGEGPSIDAIHDDHEDGVHAPDLAREPRWPTFGARAIESGIGEVLAVRLIAPPQIAVLTLYGGVAGGLDERDRLVAALYADQAAVALAGARRVAQLTAALESRDTIGCAKGILIERFGLTEEQAFARLASGSQAVNVKLRTVAEWFVRESELAARDPAGPNPPGDRPGGPGSPGT